MSAPETYELYAIRYAHHDRPASENFIGGDPHNGPMPLDYFVWAIVGEKRTFVFDTGFDAEVAQRRKREFLRSPGDGLKLIGVDPAKVEDVIVSHMHYDHVGNHTLFPNARYHLQDKEMIYATGRYMCHPAMRYPFYPEDVAAMVHRVFAGKVVFHDGVDEIAPGLSVHHVGGHTMGLQVVRAWTRRGWVVLASDAVAPVRQYEPGTAIPRRVQRRRHAGGPQALPAARELTGSRHPGPRPAGAEALSGAAAGAGGDRRAARCRSSAAVSSNRQLQIRTRRGQRTAETAPRDSVTRLTRAAGEASRASASLVAGEGAAAVLRLRVPVVRLAADASMAS